jgi:hypothetical protein
LKWQTPALLLLPFGVGIIGFTVLQFCFKDWIYNYPYQIILAIDSLESETQKNTLHGLMYAPLVGLWLIGTYCWNRLGTSDLKAAKMKELEKEFDEKYR